MTFQHEQSAGMRAQDLTVRRGTEVLFKALSFELQAGQLVWLRGSNGSGKTSLLRVLAGLSRPDGGQLHWNTQTLSESEDYRARLVYMGHANALKDDLTAVEALRFLTTVHGRVCPQDRMEAALRRMGVFHRRKLPVRMLSQGQRRRVALARLALEDRPGLWILDEPFDALDDAGLALVQELFRENVQRGGIVLFTSHIPVRPEGLPLVELTLQGTRAAPRSAEVMQ
ncbi:cytochrome c biogenesis heme-transporting ATPase CcmA [Rhodoferax sp. GW822-FHT02A01]|uniref:cytochrome c biogenesis heme-transporting ATPase CcmA n=1 Tax=Rhodoferax sp. GW822-FHT02A01 TaxID=3141537 RepID=UPI00315C926F